MARNLSVEQFQQLMRNIPKSVADELDRAIQSEAERLAKTMKIYVSKGSDSRHELLESIRVEQGRRPLSRVVRAGGPLTTKKIGGREYDYALANEFGTSKMKAQPFFWPTYRLMKRGIRSGITRKVKAAIQKLVPLE